MFMGYDYALAKQNMAPLQVKFCFVSFELWLRPASTTPNMDAPDNNQTTYDSKTKIVVFYSLSNAFDLISGSKFREEVFHNALSSTNLERANENDGFKMTTL